MPSRCIPAPKWAPLPQVANSEQVRYNRIGMAKSESEEHPILSEEEANELVLEHTGWAESIARSVARSWNLDWQQDGLDGAALEALIFCSRRFAPSRGVPFRGYARRRIHEAATEAARESKGWSRDRSGSRSDRLAREVSVELFELFPELRSGQLPNVLDQASGAKATRASIRQLLVGAALVTTRQGLETSQPDDLMDLKKMIRFTAILEVVHQLIIWKMYWESDSMRNIAREWETDELNVIREHKEILSHLQKSIGNDAPTSPLRVRPGLKPVALKLKREKQEGPFSAFLQNLPSGAEHNS